MGRRAIVAAAVLVSATSSALACDPMIEEKAFIARLAQRHFSEQQRYLFLAQFAPLQSKIATAIDVGDTAAVCGLFDQASEMLRTFDPT
jgi:hypothetical protein